MALYNEIAILQEDLLQPRITIFHGSFRALMLRASTLSLLLDRLRVEIQ